MPDPKLPFWIPLAALVLTGAACDISKTGELGNLKFQYTADDRLIPPTFNRPIATGTRVEVKVSDATTNEAVDVLAASSDTPSILTSPQRDGDRLTLSGERAGEARITVTTTERVSDTIGVEVADIDEVVLQNPGPLLTPVQGTPAVIDGADVAFPMTLKDSRGRTLIGYGTVPVDVDPASAGVQVSTDDVAHATFRFTGTGSATVRPQNSVPIPVNIISGEDVSGLTLTPLLSGASNEIPLNGQGYFTIKGTTADNSAVVGLADVAEVISETISICTTEPLPVLGDGVFLIRPLAAGECRLKGSHNGLSATLSFQVVESS